MSAAHPTRTLLGGVLRAVRGCLLLILLALAIPGTCITLVRSTFCQAARTEVLAPDGAYDVVLTSSYCDGGALGGSTSYAVKLRLRPDWLVPGVNALREVVLVKLAEPSGPAEVDWVDSRALVISYRLGMVQRRLDRPHERDTPHHLGPTEWRGVRIQYRPLDG